MRREVDAEGALEAKGGTREGGRRSGGGSSGGGSAPRRLGRTVAVGLPRTFWKAPWSWRVAGRLREIVGTGKGDDVAA